jgi:5S rRNA maturation endonuclease (ribonuclease M5)
MADYYTEKQIKHLHNLKDNKTSDITKKEFNSLLEKIELISPYYKKDDFIFITDLPISRIELSGNKDFSMLFNNIEIKKDFKNMSKSDGAISGDTHRVRSEYKMFSYYSAYDFINNTHIDVRSVQLDKNGNSLHSKKFSKKLICIENKECFIFIYSFLKSFENLDFSEYDIFYTAGRTINSIEFYNFVKLNYTNIILFMDYDYSGYKMYLDFKDNLLNNNIKVSFIYPEYALFKQKLDIIQRNNSNTIFERKDILKLIENKSITDTDKKYLYLISQYNKKIEQEIFIKDINV